MNKKYYHLSVVIATSMFVSSCGGTKEVLPPPPVTHVVYSPGENLTALTKVHETWG